MEGCPLGHQSLRADGPNQVWSWDVTYLPTTVRGVWLYLYLVVDFWSRKVVAWDDRERLLAAGRLMQAELERLGLTQGELTALPN